MHFFLKGLGFPSGVGKLGKASVFANRFSTTLPWKHVARASREAAEIIRNAAANKLTPKWPKKSNQNETGAIRKLNQN